ncbi:MAG: peptide deformylase [Patescibacteria group bacterium]|nr:peptide deformylase [Patescibacteria group bacterium]
MPILKIETGADNPILRQKAKKIKKINSQIKEFSFALVKMLKDDDNAAGLAAPQVGHSFRIIAVKHSANEDPIALINPEIKKTSFRKDTIEEGCLSLPNILVSVKRPIKITAEALDINGKTIKIKAKGFLARVIQHEVDHLNGILIVDYA